MPLCRFVPPVSFVVAVAVATFLLSIPRPPPVIGRSYEMHLALGQEAVEGAALARRSRRLVFPQYFPNSLLPRYPWHCDQKPCVSDAPPNRVPAALGVQRVLALPRLHLPQGRRADLLAQAGLEAQEVDSSKYDRGRRDSGLVHLTRS